MRGASADRWRQVTICFLLLAACGMVPPSYSVIAVPLEAQFHPSRMVLMLAMTLLSGVGALLTPWLGALMDRVSVRRLMLMGCLLLASGFAAISIATSFTQILLAFGLLIAPANVLIGPVATTVLLSRWFTRSRGRAIGIAIAGVGAGAFLFPMITQALLDAYSWRQALRVLGVILLLLTAPAAFLVIDHPRREDVDAGDEDAGAMLHHSSGASPASAIEVLSDPSFWLIAATIAIVTAGMKGMVTNLASLAIDAGVKASAAAMLVSIYAGSSLISKLSFAAVSDRVGPRPLMFASLCGFALGMACLGQTHAGFVSIAVAVALIGLAGGLMVPMESYLAPLIFGQRAVGRAMGLLTGLILLALLTTPPLFGLIFDLTGSYRGVFWTFCGLALAALFWLPVIRLHPRSQPVAEPLPLR